MKVSSGQTAILLYDSVFSCTDSQNLDPEMINFIGLVFCVKKKRSCPLFQVFLICVYQLFCSEKGKYLH